MVTALGKLRGKFDHTELRVLGVVRVVSDRSPSRLVLIPHRSINLAGPVDTRGNFRAYSHHCPPGSSVLASNNERSGWPLITLAKMNLEEAVGGVAGWSCARSRVHKPKSNRTLVPCGSIRVVGRIGLLAKGREGRRVVFIASKRTGRVLGSSGGLLDQSIPNIRHPLAALSYIPLSVDLSTFRSEVAKSTSSVSL